MNCSAISSTWFEGERDQNPAFVVDCEKPTVGHRHNLSGRAALQSQTKTAGGVDAYASKAHLLDEPADRPKRAPWSDREEVAVGVIECLTTHSSVTVAWTSNSASPPTVAIASSTEKQHKNDDQQNDEHALWLP
jgi:hypothetical protein